MLELAYPSFHRQSNRRLFVFFHQLRNFLVDEHGNASRLLVWILGFFAFLNVYSMQALVPLVMHDFNASPAQAGATVGATVLAVALVSPFIGMLSDAYGRKVIIGTSLLLLTLPTALISLADSLGTILLMRFMQGLAIPGIAVVLIAYIAEEFRVIGAARMTAAYVGGTVMGGFSGRFITGHVGHLIGWRGAFVTLALMNPDAAPAPFPPAPVGGQRCRLLRTVLAGRYLYLRQSASCPAAVQPHYGRAGQCLLCLFGRRSRYTADRAARGPPWISEIPDVRPAHVNNRLAANAPALATGRHSRLDHLLLRCLHLPVGHHQLHWRLRQRRPFAGHRAVLHELLRWRGGW